MVWRKRCRGGVSPQQQLINSNMCGITGFTGKRNDIFFKKMLAKIAHRGRDERTIWSEGEFNLGMNRLAINDLRPGLYPMKFRHLRLVYNGEIYNAGQLRLKLKAQGVKFPSNCDGEVILPLYHQYGLKSFSLLDGMFALAIVDLHKKQVVLARDKFGEKPLFYSIVEGELMFASEIKALLVSKKIDKTISTDSLSEYLQQGYVFSPRTLLKSVNKLQAGHYLMYGGKGLTTKPYFQLKAGEEAIEDMGEENLVKILEKKIRSAVKSRLLSDVPVGCFLSGGVDSSLITLFASKEIKNLHTFSVSFADGKHDESRYSKRVSRLLGINHHEIICSPEAVKLLIKRWGEITDEPICDAAMIPTYLLSKEAAKFVKVVLTGEGADEIFGGYDRYWKYLIAGKLGRFVKPIAETYSTQGIWFGDDLKNLVNGSDENIKKFKFESLSKAKDLLQAMQLVDIAGYLPDQLFRKVDMMSMRHTLEARAPFVDPDLVSFALSLPRKYKVRGTTGKYLLKKLAEKYFSGQLVWRKKHGFTLPLDEWFRGPLREIAESSVKKLSDLSDKMNPKFYKTLVNKHISKKGNYGDKIWSIIVLTAWAKKHQIKL